MRYLRADAGFRTRVAHKHGQNPVISGWSGIRKRKAARSCAECGASVGQLHPRRKQAAVTLLFFEQRTGKTVQPLRTAGRRRATPYHTVSERISLSRTFKICRSAHPPPTTDGTNTHYNIPQSLRSQPWQDVFRENTAGKALRKPWRSLTTKHTENTKMVTGHPNS